MDFVARIGGVSVEVGSSLKICRIADGFADFYPRLKRLHEWDIAAGHGVLKAAHGNFYYQGTCEELRYGSSTLETPPFEAY
jgi:3'(2'), 5'-bisphosphate nucleotidase